MDGVGVYFSHGEVLGLSMDGGLQAVVLSSKDGNPLGLKSFIGSSTLTSGGVPGLGGELLLIQRTIQEGPFRLRELEEEYLE